MPMDWFVEAPQRVQEKLKELNKKGMTLFELYEFGQEMEYQGALFQRMSEIIRDGEGKESGMMVKATCFNLDDKLPKIADDYSQEYGGAAGYGIGDEDISELRKMKNDWLD